MLMFCFIITCFMLVRSFYTAKVGIFLECQKKNVSFLVEKLTILSFCHSNSVLLSIPFLRVY